jgi:hypothetical protein
VRVVEVGEAEQMPGFVDDDGAADGVQILEEGDAAQSFTRSRKKRGRALDSRAAGRDDVDGLGRRDVAPGDRVGDQRPLLVPADPIRQAVRLDRAREVRPTP